MLKTTHSLLLQNEPAAPLRTGHLVHDRQPFDRGGCHHRFANAAELGEQEAGQDSESATWWARGAGFGGECIFGYDGQGEPEFQVYLLARHQSYEGGSLRLAFGPPIHGRISDHVPCHKRHFRRKQSFTFFLIQYSTRSVYRTCRVMHVENGMLGKSDLPKP